MASDIILSIDLGGTNLRVAAVTAEGKILEREKRSSDAKSTTSKTLRNIEEAIRTIVSRLGEQQKMIQGIALGFPGIVDPEKGVVYQSPHFPNWKNLAFADHFRKKFPWPVKADNDANLAALGEGWLGVGKGLKNFVMITLGTGVGGALVLDGKIFHGDRGFAGEVGHICIETHGYDCACGSHGCLEMYVSTQGILRNMEHTDDTEGREKFLVNFRGNIDRVTVQDLYEAALDGNIFANVTFKKMGYYLGIGLASLINTLGVDTFVIGGGVSYAWDFFADAARKELSEHTYRETASHVQLKKAVLGDDAGLVGGVKLF